MNKSERSIKNVKIQILKIMKDRKVHQKDDLAEQLAIQKKLSIPTLMEKNKEGRPKWETLIRNALSELNKAGLIIHKKDKNGKKILTFFLITKAGLEALKLI